MKMKKPGLLVKILIAIVSGILCSLFFPEWAVKIFVTFNSIFGNFLGLFIPVLIIGLIAPGIAELGGGAGKLLLITVFLAYLSTIIAGMSSYLVCVTSFPHVLGESMTTFGNLQSSNVIDPFFTIEMPGFISVTSALVFAFLLGLGITAANAIHLKNLVLDFRNLVNVVIKNFIIPLLPFYIFGIFLKMGAEGNVTPVLGMFVKMILVIFALHVAFLVFQFIVAGLISGRRPFKALITMIPAYLTALGTMSSAATIPVTLAQAKKLGVNEEIADFTIPLCATVHLSCSILKIVACAVALSLSMGMDVSFPTYLQFVLMLAVTMVAAPGVPGGAIMASLGLLSSMLGFNADMQGLMIALYIAMDSFGTAGNVTGDGAITLIVDTIYKKFSGLFKGQVTA